MTIAPTWKIERDPRGTLNPHPAFTRLKRAQWDRKADSFYARDPDQIHWGERC